MISTYITDCIEFVYATGNATLSGLNKVNDFLKKQTSQRFGFHIKADFLKKQISFISS